MQNSVYVKDFGWKEESRSNSWAEYTPKLFAWSSGGTGSGTADDPWVPVDRRIECFSSICATFTDFFEK